VTKNDGERKLSEEDIEPIISNYIEPVKKIMEEEKQDSKSLFN